MTKIVLQNRFLSQFCCNSRNGIFPCSFARSQSGVTTWSALATAFNSRPNPKINLSLLREDTGLFMKPELQSHEGFVFLKERAVNDSERLIKEVISTGRKRKLVEVFDELSDNLCKVADLAEFIRIAHPKAAFAHAAEDACISISCVVEKLNTHYQLYSTLHNVVINGDICTTSDIDDHVAKLFMFDFEQCGIHLPEAQRQKVVDLNDYILQLGQRFMNGAVQPRSIQKDILPENVRQFFSLDGDNVIVSGLYADSSNAAAREAAFKLFLYPNNHQEYLLSEMLKARQELAKICGFQTYAHRALKASTIESPEAVTAFLDILSDKLYLRANEDFSTMQLMKANECPSAKDLAAWDTPYFTQKIKKQWLQVGSSEFAPYFSLGGCMEGLDNLMQSLFGIKFVLDEMAPGEAWANDIYKLKIVHETEGLLGHIYCDFYERSGKPNQDCHFTIQGGKLMPDGKYQNPIVVVVLNLSPPRWSTPTLLSPSMVDNLFHEMGHAMHSMLARTKYQHITGTRCSTDFAEVPSVLMEYFASDPRVVNSFARHFQTQEKMPQHMLERLCASKSLFGASEMQLQVFYSALDQYYHGSNFTGVTTDALRKIQKKYYSLPYVANTAWQLRFGHLVGYGAKYYSYLVSRAIASLIWQVYFEAEPFSRSQGEAYRRECLAHGGGKPSKQLVADFLKRDLTPKCLADALINEIDAKKIQIDKIRFMNELQ